MNKKTITKTLGSAKNAKIEMECDYEDLGGMISLINCSPSRLCIPTSDECEGHECLDFDKNESLAASEKKIDEAFEHLKELHIDQKSAGILMDQFYEKFPDSDLSECLIRHKNIRPFAAGGNIFEDSDGIDNPTLFVMRWLAGIKMTEVMDILKFDMNDSNLMQDLTVGNIGTPQRWAKTVTGSDLEDDSEMMCGRYTKPPRLATFPNTHPKGLPIIKKCSLSSVCSHHLLAYGSLFTEDSYAVVAYIPKDFVLGISKLQRVVNWVSKRPTIQEDLTMSIWKQISQAAQTEDVYVGLFNLVHTCESLRGSKTHQGSFTTEWYEGAFNDEALRMSILQNV